MTTSAVTNNQSGTTGRLMRSGIVGLMLTWLLVATGETLYGELDGTTDLGEIADAAGRFGAGTLLQLAAAVLLAGAATGMMLLLRDRAPRLGLVGGWLTLAGAVGLGSFAQTHMLMLAMADASLDRVALNAFLAGPMAEGGGLWTIPIMFVLVLLPVGLLLLALGAASAGLSSRWPAALIIAHVVIHLGFSQIPVLEVGSHYILAVALAWLGWNILHHLGAKSPA